MDNPRSSVFIRVLFPVQVIASSGHASTHAPQPMQRLSRTIISGSRDWLSGLWHHQQRNGHPFRKTAVRMPGPSWME